MQNNPDINYHTGEFADRTRESFGPLALTPPNAGAGYDDIFKVSHCVNCQWDDIEVKAGKQRENALDLNRNSCGNLFRRLVLDAGEQGAILVKGGSSNNTWDNVLIREVGSGHSDIMIGGYSGQSKAKSHNNRFHNIRRADGQPIRVAWCFTRASKPVITGSNVKYQYGWSLVRTIAQEWSYLTA